MTSTKRKFTEDQKLAILDQADKIGISAALREHKLSYSVFSRWKLQHKKSEADGQGMISINKVRSELKHLQEENGRLKKIIADMALELERKAEELRKMNSLSSKR